MRSAFPCQDYNTAMKPPLAAVVLNYPIPFSAASACEQAFSRELLLPLTQDTVLAAVPWLSLRRKNDTSLDRLPSNELITTDSVEPIIRHRPFVRLTSLGEGRALDGQIATMSSASEQADCASWSRSMTMPSFDR